MMSTRVLAHRLHPKVADDADLMQLSSIMPNEIKAETLS